MKTRPGLLIGVLLCGFCAILAGSPPPAARHAPSADPLSGIVVNATVHSPALVGNLLGDSPDRPVAIYLPPGYASSASRFPVIYLLHGYGSTNGGNRAWTKGDWANVPKMMDRLIAAGTIRKMIVVMPDASDKLGGAFYTNSVAAGNWEDFITRDLVSDIDARYRTIRRAASRGIAGHS
ncbi:MAG: alpha/beta hydrolase-fold protein, partial [Terriglobales bacterium]